MRMIRYVTFIAVLLGITLAMASCGGSDSDRSHQKQAAVDELEVYRQAFLQIESVPIVNPAADPLQTALGLIGIDREHLELPLYLEENYRLLARNPLIDRLARRPLELNHWAEEMSDGLQQTQPAELFEVVERIAMDLNGGVSYAGRLRPQGDYGGGLVSAYEYLCRQNGIAVIAGERERIRQAGFTSGFDRLLGTLVYALTDAAELSRKAVAGLSPAEIEYLSKRPERYFFNSDGTFRFLSAPTHTHTRLLRLARKIDFPSLFAAGLILARAVDHVSVTVRDAGVLPHQLLFFKQGHPQTGIILELETPLGPIIVLGSDDNTLTRPGALVVDLGGNDRYPAPVAAGHLVPGRSALHIDLGGDDYYGKKTLSLSQGVGCLSVGLLADFDGSDEYRSAHMAQGCGIYGLGLMVDFSGDDIYSMGLIGQGFGLFGLGLLLDRDGNDRYLATGMGQGVGSTMGYGVLCDSRGNDKYLADRQRLRPGLEPDVWCHAQGVGMSVRSPDWEKQASFYGGVGLLSDGSGNDFYHATGGNCMGSSYFMSVGALVDHDGDDTYMPEKGYGMGFAVHLSNAVLVDRAGNDQYFAASHSGGVASDRSIALLIDYDGDDLYGPTDRYVQDVHAAVQKERPDQPDGSSPSPGGTSLATLSYGAAQKRKALGVLIDFRGNDRYYAQAQGQGESLGGVMPPQFPQYWSRAVLLDLGGQDHYALPGRRDNTYFKYQHHGICYDTELAGRQLPVQTTMVVEPRRMPPEGVFVDTKAVKSYGTVLQALADPDLFVRFHALGQLLQSGAGSLDALLAGLSACDDRELSRDLLEALNHFYFNRSITAEDSARIGPLLSAPDPHVRQYAARLIGTFARPEDLPFLTQALSTATADTRAHIAWALGNIGASAATPALLTMAQDSAGAAARHAAAEALEAIALKKSPVGVTDEKALRSGLRTLQDDTDEVVRFHAVSALARYRDDPEVLTQLRARFEDRSIYVRRAAARTVIESGDKAGIGVLIDSLRFPSIDTFDFYDEDLVKELAFYCGVDFPDDRRYAYDTWNDWWRQHGRTVNLGRNLIIKKEIEAAFATYPEQGGTAVFERLMQTEPGNAMVKRRYERFCRDRIRYLLASRTITRDIIARCLVLQRKLSELEPDNPKIEKQVELFEKRLSEL